MASLALPLAERADVHKSCKSIETLLGLLNDYCEASGAMGSLRKKLAKALKDMAGLKITTEIVGKALTSGATIYESMSEVDSKFAKFVDKEYDAVSNEVKKWFKKLAKEEKLHDERIAGANAKIKQAGQNYEKKLKKNAQSASEEHTRYVALISNLGPEIAQEKYNHTLMVTQKQTIVSYSVAACLARIADAEWLRACESVRRFSLTIGTLGEWKALCEGAWMGNVPPDLPELSIEEKRRLELEWRQDEGILGRVEEERKIGVYGQQNSDVTAEAVSASADRSSSPARYSITGAPPSGYFDLANTQDRENNTNTVRTLSSFPSPPPHIPFPTPTTGSQPPPQYRSQASTPNLGQSEAPETHEFPRITESPLPTEEPESPQASRDAPSRPHSEQLDDTSPSPQDSRQEAARSTREAVPKVAPEQFDRLPRKEADTPQLRTTLRQDSFKVDDQQKSDKASSSGSQSLSTSRYGKSVDLSNYGSGDYLPDDKEFGVRSHVDYTPRPKTMDVVNRYKGLERTDTGTSSGSVVAAIRSRLSQTEGSSSPPPRDIPKLPLSVNDLATRYQSAENPSSPRARVASPSSPGQDRVLEGVSQRQDRTISGTYDRPLPTPTDADRLRQQRADKIAELEIMDRVNELRAREAEIEVRARELDRDKARLMQVRDLGYATDATRSLQTASKSPSNPRPQSKHSYSGANHLVPPLNSGPSRSRDPSPPSQRSSQSYSRQVSGERPTQIHAPYCGCEECSVAKYKERTPNPSSHDLRPPVIPHGLRPEKPRGWMRRLSMPSVSNAFSGSRNGTLLDSRKNESQTSIYSGSGDRRIYEAGGASRNPNNLSGR